MKISIPSYLKKIIKLYPSISSGRMNYKKSEKRLTKNLELTKKFIKNQK